MTAPGSPFLVDNGWLINTDESGLSRIRCDTVAAARVEGTAHLASVVVLAGGCWITVATANDRKDAGVLLGYACDAIAAGITVAPHGDTIVNIAHR